MMTFEEFWEKKVQSIDLFSPWYLSKKAWNACAKEYEVELAKSLDENSKLRAALEKWLALEYKSIAWNGPYEGAEISKCIKLAKETLNKLKDEKMTLREAMYEHIYKVLFESNWSRAKAHKDLAVSSRGLRIYISEMRQLGYAIEQPVYAEPKNGLMSNEERLEMADRLINKK